jgi:carbonic anhydrase/acetyltransferase-like protein (isoleucine patch superfamily)
LGFEIRYPDPNDVRRRKFAGVYAFSNRALRLIPSNGFVEIKEQLLSSIAATGEPLHSFDFTDYSGSVDSPDSYLRLQREQLHRGTFARVGCRECAPGVWVEHGASIADGARLVGPLLIGSRAVVDEGVHLVGPAVVGPECRIDSDAFVRESVLWPGAHVKAGERLEYAILGSRSWKRPVHGLDDIVRIAPKRFREKRTGFANLLHRVTKRSIDLVAAVLGLTFGLPLFAMIAVAIKLDSPGPVFFVQRRVGRGGCGYPMIKFRSMREDAAGMQSSMRNLNDVDGPVFKIFGDPRVTRLGRFLRRTSLDELPQLVNVLLGQMSLVDLAL